MKITSKPPVFIVGSPRSGTTLLRLILDSHPNLSSGPETQFLLNFQEIVGLHWYRIKRFGFEKKYWHEKIAVFFDTFQMEYAINRGKSRWVEKSPNYLHCLDFVNQLFPECQILHIIRDGRDVVASYRDRWGYGAAIKATKSWAKDVRLAQGFGSRVSPNKYFEVRYEDLVSTPESTLKSILEYIDEPWDPVLLKYDSVEHDEPDWLADFTDKRRKKGKDKSLIYRSQVGSGVRNLDPLLRFFVHRNSGDLLQALGYTSVISKGGE